jgi:hypothetical protein
MAAPSDKDISQSSVRTSRKCTGPWGFGTHGPGGSTQNLTETSPLRTRTTKLVLSFWVPERHLSACPSGRYYFWRFALWKP